MGVKPLLFLIFIFCVFSECNFRNIEVFVGGLFDDDGYEKEVAFQHAIDNVNSEKFIRSYKVVPLSKRVQKDNNFDVLRTMCPLLSYGIVGLFSSTSEETSHYVQSMCDTKEIPHIEMREDTYQPRHMCAVNLFPYPQTLSEVFIDLVKAYGWKKFTILYENFDEIPYVNEMLKIYDSREYATVVRELNEFQDKNYRPVLTEAKRAGETHFVIHSSIENLEEILTQAQQVGLMSDDHNYIIMNPDMHTLDMTPFQYGGANITGVRFIDPLNANVSFIAHQLYERKKKDNPELEEDVNSYLKLRSTTALVYDAVYHFAHAFVELDKHKSIKATPLFCNSTDNWQHGYSLINLMKTTNMYGLTGEISFDNQGYRKYFEVDIIELTPEGLQKIGTWNFTKKLRIIRPIPNASNGDDDSLRNRTFVVITAISPPYGMLKESSTILTGNDRYEGFGIDLIEELSKMLGFNYTFRIQEDAVYGGYDNKTGQWTGMLRELMDYRADLAITDLTITSERESGVDFTMPFMNLGIQILYKKPMKVPPKLFSFTSPLSFRVWYYLGGAYFFVSILLFVIGRISPDEWTNPYPCVEEPEYLHNQFSLKNCFWFTMGSLMQQGSEIAPIGIATRMVAGLWWFFTIIMVSSYTANLAAFLTVETLYSPIKNIEDLAQQDVIKYGAKTNGATASFFRDSNYSTYRKIWEYMKANPDVMTRDNPTGVMRANNENYAFLMESTSIEYTVERYCNLSEVGGLLDNKGYGIAMRKNSTYRHTLSTSVLKLQESGKLAVLKNKWWKEKRGGGRCTAESSSDGAAELSFQNVGGVFLVLGCGCLLGLIVAFCEMLVGVWSRSLRNNVSFRQELATEWAFVVKFKGQSKPNTCRKSMSPGESNKSINEPFNSYGFSPAIRKQSTGQTNHLSSKT